SNGSALNSTKSEFSSSVILSEPRSSHTATVLASGRILIVGGNNNTDASPSPSTAAEIYDPDIDVRYSLAVAGNFYQPGDMNTGRYAHTATLLPNGKVLIAGGY